MRLALIAAFVVSLLTGCNRGPTAEEVARALAEQQRQEQQRLLQLAQQAISEVLQADAKTNLGNEPSATARRMRAIDTSACPTDFRVAYELHTQAWEDQAKLKALRAELNSDERVGATVIESVVSSLFAMKSTPIQNHLEANAKLSRAEAQVSENINDSFRAVKRVALKYGAKLPQ